MLSITVSKQEAWDEQTNQFVYVDGATLLLEHSLVSIYKWEQKWNIPFLDSKQKMTPEQEKDYFKCMTITKGVDDIIYDFFSAEDITRIKTYINSPMTATWFGDSNKKSRVKRVITAEIIYSWMITLGIPMECQKWHFNSLITLIQVCSEENAPKKKMNQREIIERNRMINEARRAATHSKG